MKLLFKISVRDYSENSIYIFIFLENMINSNVLIV